MNVKIPVGGVRSRWRQLQIAAIAAKANCDLD